MPQQPQSLPDIMWIRWRDACFHHNENYTADDVKGLVDIFSCGVFVKETDEYYTIGLDYHEESETFRELQSIPKVNVIECVKLKVNNAIQVPAAA